MRKRLIGLALVAVLVLSSAVTGQSPKPVYPLSMSGTTYLQDWNQRPWFINGDTAWSLVSQLTDGEAATYLSDRQAKGYNAIIVELIEKNGTNGGILSDDYGNAPFTGAAFSTPNSAFFGHVDTKLTDAANKDIAVFLFPCYLGFNSNEGWSAEVIAASTGTMQGYGTFLGNRYKNYKNIVWVVGGDVDPAGLTGVQAKVDAFVVALKATGDGHPITAHGVRQQSGREAFPGVSWLDFSSTYPSDTTGPAEAAANYGASPFMPSFLVEAYYENEHAMTALGLRSQAYWTLLRGSYLGHFFGNSPVWSFDFWPVSGHDWVTDLNSTGSQQLALVGRLFNSRAFNKLVPDLTSSVMTLGVSSGTTIAATSRASDGSSVIAYIPTQRAVTFDMTKVAGATAQAWWFNPATGATTNASTFATSGTQAFTPPDTNDWILVLDNAALGLTAPGTVPYYGRGLPSRRRFKT